MSYTVSIRPVELTDMPAITAIYQHYVRTHTSTFEIDPPDLVEMTARLQRIRDAGSPYLVAEEAGQVLGYGYAGPYRPRAAYRHTVENSVYLHSDHVGRGIGGRLLATLIEQCTQAGYREMIAVIGDSQNHASIGLHVKAGFVHVGTLRNVGFKFERWLDTVLMQKSLNGSRE
jgi:L-amino acid N-acyltransferase YncA